jgi:hypothetical protein
MYELHWSIILALPGVGFIFAMLLFGILSNRLELESCIRELISIAKNPSENPKRRAMQLTYIRNIAEPLVYEDQK